MKKSNDDLIEVCLDHLFGHDRRHGHRDPHVYRDRHGYHVLPDRHRDRLACYCDHLYDRDHHHDRYH